MRKVGIAGIGIERTQNPVSEQNKVLFQKAQKEACRQAGINVESIESIIETEDNCDSLIAIDKVYRNIRNGRNETAMIVSYLNRELLEQSNISRMYCNVLRIPYCALLGLFHQKVLNDLKLTEEDTAYVCVKNKTNALHNHNGIYAENITIEDYLKEDYISYPLRRKDVAPSVYGVGVIIMAGEEKIKKLDCQPVWIEGISFIKKTPNIEMELENYYEELRKMCKELEKESGISDIISRIDIYEVDDSYSFMELVNLSVIGYGARVTKLLKSNYFGIDGEKSVNASGGALGCGNCYNTMGIFRINEAVKQLRNRGKNTYAFISSYGGFPSQSFAGLIIKI